MASRDGYFPRGSSVLRMVHEERAVGLMYGQRALMVGAMHPIAFTGTILDTNALRAPWQRLAHTGKVFETIYFGSRAQADDVLAFVHKLHARVRGTTPEGMGRWPAGTHYSAFDSELMLWTVAVIADSAEVLFETFVRRLSDDERDSLWRDYLRFAELFGMPVDGAPASHREFRAWWNEMFAGGELHLTEDARRVGKQIAFHIPLPSVYWPASQVHNLLLLGTLPNEIREAYGIGWSRAQAAAFRTAAAAIRAPHVLAPRPISRGGNAPAFQLVARTERSRLAKGHTVMRVSQLTQRRSSVPS